MKVDAHALSYDDALAFALSVPGVPIRLSDGWGITIICEPNDEGDEDDEDAVPLGRGHWWFETREGLDYFMSLFPGGRN